MKKSNNKPTKTNSFMFTKPQQLLSAVAGIVLITSNLFGHIVSCDADQKRLN